MPSRTRGFEGLLEAVPDALVGVDRFGVIRFVNHQTESLFGYEPNDLVGAPLDTLVPQSLPKVHAAHLAGKPAPGARPAATDLILSGRRRDGSEFPVDLSLSPVNTGGDRLVIAAVHDMTSYQRAEAMHRRLERLAALIEFSPEAIVGNALDGVITSWNPAAERLYGYSCDEIVGRSIILLSPESRVREAKEMLAKFDAGPSRQTAQTFETLRVRKDRSVFPATLTVSPIRDSKGTVVGASTITHDMTEQRQAFEAAQHLAEIVEGSADPFVAAALGDSAVGDRTLGGVEDPTGQTDALRAEARELREALAAARRTAAIVEHADDAIFGTTLDGAMTSWNPAAERLYGYPRDDVVGKSIDLLSPKDRTVEITAILAEIKAGEHVESFETSQIRRDGTVFPASVTVSPIRGADGTVVGASTIARDLTNQKEASDLAISMIESSLDPLVTISPQGKITHANEATVRATGVPRLELIGTPFSDYFTAPEKANRIYQRVFSEGTAVDYPLTLRHRDGTETAVLYNASVYRDTSGSVLGVFAAARDVTQQIQAQRKVAEQQGRELDRLAELERFQRLMVGRELKMIEMKKEIEYLRKLAPVAGGEPGGGH